MNELRSTLATLREAFLWPPGGAEGTGIAFWPEVAIRRYLRFEAGVDDGQTIQAIAARLRAAARDAAEHGAPFPIEALELWTGERGTVHFRIGSHETRLTATLAWNDNAHELGMATYGGTALREIPAADVLFIDDADDTELHPVWTRAALEAILGVPTSSRIEPATNLAGAPRVLKLRWICEPDDGEASIGVVATQRGAGDSYEVEATCGHPLHRTLPSFEALCVQNAAFLAHGSYRRLTTLPVNANGVVLQFIIHSDVQLPEVLQLSLSIENAEQPHVQLCNDHPVGGFVGGTQLYLPCGLGVSERPRRVVLYATPASTWRAKNDARGFVLARWDMATDAG